MPEYMWIFQLEEDTDVIAQYEAIQGLKAFVPSNSYKAIEALNKTLWNEKIFYKVRAEAAMALAKVGVYMSWTDGSITLFLFVFVWCIVFSHLQLVLICCSSSFDRISMPKMATKCDPTTLRI
jgi:hypothetical protein